MEQNTEKPNISIVPDSAQVAGAPVAQPEAIIAEADVPTQIPGVNAAAEEGLRVGEIVPVDRPFAPQPVETPADPSHVSGHPSNPFTALEQDTVTGEVQPVNQTAQRLGETAVENVIPTPDEINGK